MTQPDRATADIVAAIEKSIEAATEDGDELTDEELDDLIERHLPDMSADAISSTVESIATIHSLSIRGVRSFGPEQTLRLSEGLTVIYAGNGRGKTSLTDALELAVHGDTSRRIGLPNATTEVKDQVHIAHRTSNGEHGASGPPRVRIEFRRRNDLAVATWTEFGAPAPNHPDIQILPRRLLRELVNAKRTERAAPLGIALGLNTIETWSAVADELRNRSKQLKGDVVNHLQLLLDELSGEVGVAEINCWANEQGAHPDIFAVPPPPAPWQQLADDLERSERTPQRTTSISSELEAFLRQFLEIAEPGVTCPACTMAVVPDDRIADIQLSLAESRETREQAELQKALRARRTELEASLASWLRAASPTDEASASRTDDWTEARQRLEQLLGNADDSRGSKWCIDVADSLANMEVVRNELISRNTIDDEARLRAVASIRHDAQATLEQLRDQEHQQDFLAPLLHRANQRTRALLIDRVEQEFKELEQPINEWLAILGPTGTPQIRFSLTQTAYRPSLELRIADFPEAAKPPHVTGHFSDAQLDMLGMSAHLARIERDHPGATIVIDDPSDMLDSHSRKALAGDGIGRLLDTNSGPAHQVVVLTHDDQLVQDLWQAHRDRSPTMVQDTIETITSDDGADSYSMFTSRDAGSAVARAKEMIDLHWNLWAVSSFVDDLFVDQAAIAA